MRSEPVDAELPAVHEAWLPREHSLHRPRHGSRQAVALVCAAVFFAAPTLMWVAGMRPAEIENHRLAAFPSVTDGWGFFAGFDPWATDHLSFRAEAIAIADAASRDVFGEPPRFATGQGGGGPLPDDRLGPTGGGSEPTEPGTTQGRTSSYAVLEGRDGWLYLADDMAAKCNPSRPVAQTVALLADLRAAVERSGREFVLFVAPDKSTMVPQFLPATYPNKECADKVGPELWSRVVTEARALDPRSALTARGETLGRPVYYPLDTHWTDDGSVIMVRQLADTISPGVTASWRTPEASAFSIPADLPSLQGKTGQREGVMYELRPDGTQNRLGQSETNISLPVRRSSAPIAGTVDDRVLVLGDSFTGVTTPYLSAAFTDLTVLHYLSANVRPGQMIQEMADHEVVVLEMVERSLAVGGGSWLNADFVRQVGADLAKRPVQR